MSARTFDARYPGKCPACQEPISIGDTLTFGEDDIAVHAECVNHWDDRGGRRLKPQPTCPECWQEKSVSGECGCSA